MSGRAISGDHDDDKWMRFGTRSSLKQFELAAYR